MKRIFTLLLVVCFTLSQKTNSQVLLNELYTDPGAGKHEFFELYNSTTSSSWVSMNNYTLVTFFEISGQKGFYVMDLPDFSVGPKGYFVGSAALPFNYQGVINSTASDFSWNSSAFTLNNGSIKKWVQGGLNLLDGNLFYDQAALPANFNDFFFRRTGNGSSYTVFLYYNGALVNTFLGGTGGQSTILSDIVSMPQLYVDMSSASPDFTINFSGYGSIPVEYCNQDAGSDNGFIRERDGACGEWVKSSSQVQHTPKASNGTLIGITGTISVAAAISRGTQVTGSTINYDIVAGPASSFPVEMQLYLDNGTVLGQLDPTDTYITSKTENVISDGPFYTNFHPYDADILIVVKTNVGCFDKILYIPNAIILSVKMVSFEGTRLNMQTKLSWSVKSNETISHFEVERSIEGGEFSAIGVVFATEEIGAEDYMFTESISTDREVIYRLKTIDKGGVAAYSKNLVFQSKPTVTNNSLTLYGNPVTDKLNFSYTSSATRAADIKVYDMTGNIHITQRVNSNKGNNMFSLSLSPSFKPGLYVVEVNDGIERKLAKFVKQ